MGVTPEGKIKREINKLLDKYGCYRFMPVPGQFGKKTVDYLVCAFGTFIAIEAKAPGKKPTPLQILTMQEVYAAHGETFCIDGPQGLAALEIYLDVKQRASIRETQSLGRAA